MNVLEFLLLGLQARIVLAGLRGEALWSALQIAGITLSLVIGVRIVWVMSYGPILQRILRLRGKQAFGMLVPGVRIGMLLSRCGMRGLVTLAAALGLPGKVPGRDTIVISEFLVVLGTLVVPGFTMRPLI